jgi:hypothetical protein
MVPLSRLQRLLRRTSRYQTSPYYYLHLRPPTPSTHIFSDSSASIKAIISSDPPKNRCVGEIRNLLGCLKSSGTIATLYWIPSHTGIAGNEEADRLASEEAQSPSGNTIKNEMSPGEQLTIQKTGWESSVLLTLRRCKKPSVQMKNKLGIIPWRQSNDRATNMPSPPTLKPIPLKFFYLQDQH